MKDIAILTKYYKNYNYGGMLQGYALHRIVEKLGYSADIISYDVRDNENPVYKNVFQQCKQYGFKSAASKIIEKVIAKLGFSINGVLMRRRELFDQFMDFVDANTTAYTDENLETLNDRYKMFISGSDQIWNPNAVRKLYLQGFVHADRKRIAYAASFGRGQLSDYEAKLMIPYIQEFNYLGIREKTGTNLLKNYIDKPVATVLDPTLLLTEEEWSEVSAERIINEPYVLIYFFSDNVSVRKQLRQFCTEKNLKIVLIPYAKQEFNFGDAIGDCIRLKDVGPCEFISAIKYADYVFTDSFHGAVFSIIHNRQFWVFERSKKEHVSMNSRLYDLLETFQLRSRLISHIDISKIEEEIKYTAVKEILRSEKKKSLDFLISALEG